ncbi:hypothetical protein CONPUDRAFT_83748 [Coniophora puteana RWD-64-598 SS2]|uniref:Uncharacterized protein n=1 Tax=Coniophora puteana (strain RWD-64-598) TaxID=741705 RepID=A0A5M3MI05_CONPW|nr:uncharacterized protein CONPUDRAFT_83748 [Coniophora puteana RWD-64-598 SS2]EIW78275.1 hypothetical protein CONPUDRAFT_83748 [Coniophora puteana RWD-64-598 SS2]
MPRASSGISGKKKDRKPPEGSSAANAVGPDGKVGCKYCPRRVHPNGLYMHETTCEKRRKESRHRNEISSRHATLERESRLLSIQAERASVGPSRQAGPSWSTTGLHIAPSISTFALAPSISTHVPTPDDVLNQHHNDDDHNLPRGSIDESPVPLDAPEEDAARLRSESDASM